MDPYLYTLIILIFSISAVIILFMALIVFLRFFTTINERNYQRKAALWEEGFLNFLQGDLKLKEAEKIFGRDKNFNWFWRFLAPYLEVLDGEDFEKTKSLSHAIGLISYFQVKLKFGGSAAKALSASGLGKLRCRESVPEIITLLEHSSPMVVQAAALGLAKSESPDTFALVARSLIKNTNFTYDRTTEILTSYGPEICETITATLADIIENPGSGKNRLERRSPKRIQDGSSIDISVYISMMIDLLGHYRYREALPILNSLLAASDEEVTVHVLKAILSIGQAPARLDLQPLLLNRYWVIRSFSARVWKLIQDEKMLPLLEAMLSDQNWWVRYHAAGSLLNAGAAGRAILQNMTESSNQLSAGISRYVLNINEVQQ